MSETHVAYLNLGSNIQPEINLPKALSLLALHGEILQSSHVWESESVGVASANYLNMCVSYKVNVDQVALKENILRPIEQQLGRQRHADKYTPRPMDIDIILFDDQVLDETCLSQAFVVVPLADIYPAYRIHATNRTLHETATQFRQTVWLEMRRGILS